MTKAIERVDSSKLALELLARNYPELVSAEPIFQRAIELNLQGDLNIKAIDSNLSHPLQK